MVTNEKCITFGGRGTDHTNFALFSTYANYNPSGNRLCSHLINKICTNIHLLKYLYILLIKISNCKHFNKRDNVIKSKRKQCFVIAITLNRELDTLYFYLC